MLVEVNGVDITEHINTSTYQMNESKVYASWQDGNYREHRIYTRKRVEGSFEVFLYGADNMKTQDFLDLWESATHNEIVTITLFVQNINKMEVVEAFFKFEGTFHREMVNGEYCDKLTVEITER